MSKLNQSNSKFLIKFFIALLIFPIASYSSELQTFWDSAAQFEYEIKAPSEGERELPGFFGDVDRHLPHDIYKGNEEHREIMHEAFADSGYQYFTVDIAPDDEHGSIEEFFEHILKQNNMEVAGWESEQRTVGGMNAEYREMNAFEKWEGSYYGVKLAIYLIENKSSGHYISFRYDAGPSSYPTNQPTFEEVMDSVDFSD
jgi:hypothetical protein